MWIAATAAHGNMSKIKQCAICGAEFEANTNAKYCLKCREKNTYMRHYYGEHKADYAAYAREYAKTHRSEINEYAKKYYHDHLETVRATARRSAAKRRAASGKTQNAARQKMYLSEYNRAYYAANKERIAAQRKEKRKTQLSGYQQAILALIGMWTDGRFLVRSVDKWYIDAVSDLFPTAPYLQKRNDGKKDFWTLKSAKVDYRQELSAVKDKPGFCRGVIELQGTLDFWTHRNRKGVKIATPRLRIYGEPQLLQFVMGALPAAPKKIQEVRTVTGCTCVIYYQSPAEVAEIMSYIYGSPANPQKWEMWDEIMSTHRTKEGQHD